MRAHEFIKESIDAGQVLDYVKRTHAPDEFDIEYSITDHPRWELKNIPLSQLKLDPDGEQRDPYNRVNWVDYDTVSELIPRIGAVLKSKPIVVDSQGWIIDGNHRATAAAEAGLTSVPAYVPAEVNDNFADGKVRGKSRPGRVKRSGASCKGSVADLRARAKKYGGERGKMYHWCANMKGGRNKTNESSTTKTFHARVKLPNQSTIIDTMVVAQTYELAKRLLKAQYGASCLVSNVREVK